MSGGHVRTFHAGARPGIPQDNHRIANARVQLKLAALAYEASTRRGIEGSPFVQAGIGMLSEASIRYVEALEGVDKMRVVDQGLPADERNPRSHQSRIAAARTQLQLAALSYEGTRHGADGGIGFCRAGLGMLCQGAIRYVEALENTDKSRVVDPSLALDDGM